MGKEHGCCKGHTVYVKGSMLGKLGCNAYGVRATWDGLGSLASLISLTQGTRGVNRSTPQDKVSKNSLENLASVSNAL